ncbi:MAG: DUF3445 domain-containing protein [Actinomycetota bacterium]
MDDTVWSGQGWFDEIDLDPAGHWRRLGTRQLGDRPWLVVDGRRQAELSLKEQLSADRHGEVFAIESGAEDGVLTAGRETLDLVDGVLVRLDLDGPTTGDGDLHPLDRAGRSVQEDLCLVRPGDGTWVLAAASLCFPSRWRLDEKVGRSITATHGPVDGYDRHLASRVDRLFDHLGERIVLRRNWFVHPDPSLFQPDRPPNGDPLVEADRCLDDLHLRSERQTLRRLPVSGWILFTIRIQQDPLRPFVVDDERAAALRRYLDEAPVEQLAHRGLSPDQAERLRTAIADRAP